MTDHQHHAPAYLAILELLPLQYRRSSPCGGSPLRHWQAQQAPAPPSAADRAGHLKTQPCGRSRGPAGSPCGADAAVPPLRDRRTTAAGVRATVRKAGSRRALQQVGCGMCGRLHTGPQAFVSRHWFVSSPHKCTWARFACSGLALSNPGRLKGGCLRLTPPCVPTPAHIPALSASSDTALTLAWAASSHAWMAVPRARSAQALAFRWLQ